MRNEQPQRHLDDVEGWESKCLAGNRCKWCSVKVKAERLFVAQIPFALQSHNETFLQNTGLRAVGDCGFSEWTGHQYAESPSVLLSYDPNRQKIMTTCLISGRSWPVRIWAENIWGNPGVIKARRPLGPVGCGVGSLWTGAIKCHKKMVSGEFGDKNELCCVLSAFSSQTNTTSLLPASWGEVTTEEEW